MNIFKTFRVQVLLSHTKKKNKTKILIGIQAVVVAFQRNNFSLRIRIALLEATTQVSSTFLIELSVESSSLW